MYHNLLNIITIIKLFIRQTAGASTSELPLEVTPENPHKDTLSKILAEMQPVIPKDQSQFDLLELMDELQ